MTLPVYAVWKSCVQLDTAIVVAPGLSCVQMWMTRSPATTLAGMLRSTPVGPGVVPTVEFCSDAIG